MWPAHNDSTETADPILGMVNHSPIKVILEPTSLNLTIFDKNNNNVNKVFDKNNNNVNKVFDKNKANKTCNQNQVQDFQADGGPGQHYQGAE